MVYLTPGHMVTLGRLYVTVVIRLLYDWDSKVGDSGLSTWGLSTTSLLWALKEFCVALFIPDQLPELFSL